MRKRKTGLIVLLLAGATVLAALSAAEQPLSEEAEGEWLKRGAAVLEPFKRSLKDALFDGLMEGPEAAVGACRVLAPELAAAASGPSLVVGRTSHRLRNPENAPSPWLEPLLEDYLADPEDRGPRAIRLPGERVGYVEPIVVQPMCLACHGESLAPELAERIDELYPDDRATGFQAGDFRGLFWVEFAAPQ